MRGLKESPKERSLDQVKVKVKLSIDVCLLKKSMSITVQRMTKSLCDDPRNGRGVVGGSSQFQGESRVPDSIRNHRF